MVLLFDLGATHTRLALAENSELSKVVRFDTDTSKAGYARFLGALQELAGEQTIEAVAGGCPFQLEGDDGEIVFATNVPEWTGLRFKRGIEDLFGKRVFVANDVMLCGLGEAHFGAGETKGVMAYYTVSTGVNGVRIIDGMVDATIGRYEMGYQILDTKSESARSLEQLAGGAAMEARLGKSPAQIRDAAVWREVERTVAYGLYNTLVYWDPAIIVLGGAMMRDLKVKHIQRELERLPVVQQTWPELRLATCGDNAGLLGAQVWLKSR